MSPFVSQIEWKLLTRKVDELSIAIDRSCWEGSLLLPYRMFFNGATEIPPKKILSGGCTAIPTSLANVECQQTIYASRNPTLQRRRGEKGEMSHRLWLKFWNSAVQSSVEKKLKLKNIADETPKYKNKGDLKLMI